jgi:nucleotide-binding universal stress UspA family protein
MLIRRILVPIDGSVLSLKAAENAAALAARFGASITLLTALEPPEALVASVNKAAMDEVREGLWRSAEGIHRQVEEAITSQHVQVERRIFWGNPAPTIAAEAERGYDLVVMGSRGLGLEPGDRQLLGSVTERVLRRTHCPVLVIPEHPTK